MARNLKALSTDELLVLASGQEEKASGDVISELILRYKSLVYGRALKLTGGNRSLADDIFQDTFLRVFTWLQTRDDDRPLHTFPRLLATFATRAAIDLIRKERREQSAVPIDELQLASEEEVWVRNIYLYDYLRSLDDRSQYVVKLSYFDGLSATEIAQRLKITPGYVRILKFRALEALRAKEKRDETANLIEPL